MKRIGPFVFFTFCLAAIGCTDAAVETSSAAGESQFVNTVCPIMGNEIVASEVDATLVKDFNGKKVAFCCPPCLEEWDELTDAEKTAKLASAPAESKPHSH